MRTVVAVWTAERDAGVKGLLVQVWLRWFGLNCLNKECDKLVCLYEEQYGGAKSVLVLLFCDAVKRFTTRERSGVGTAAPRPL